MKSIKERWRHRVRIKQRDLTRHTNESASVVIESTIIIQDGLGEKFGIGIQSVFAFLCGFAVALYYAWQLTLLLLAVIPVMVGIVGFAISFAPKTNSDAYNAAGSAAQEILGFPPIVLLL
jgi:ATP-binding cassette, subfamily B (MDR/TAP), member 1